MSRASNASQARSGIKAPRSQGDQMQPRQDLVDYMKQYAREKPEVAALWCFGVGFILGWKLKLW